jgi:phosphopantetheinyl transferase (holo-ACP synthase)
MTLVYHYNSGKAPLDASWRKQFDFTGEHRVQQFYQSRLALWDCLATEDCKWNHWYELEIDNHLHIKDAPHLLASLSHTKDVAAAVIGTANDQLLSVGIDLEWAERKLKPGMEKFFINEHDDIEKYQGLELWSLKEAAFKAISPLLVNWSYQRFVLNHIWIKGLEFGLIGNQQSIGCLHLKKEMHRDRQLIISLAELIKVPNS